MQGESGLRSVDSGDQSIMPAWLRKGTFAAVQPLPWGSNYSFVAAIQHEATTHLAVYKPARGEAPLWDFPQGTLYRRECAAYLVACAIGWRFIPATTIRHGPHGVGSLQVYVPADDQANYFTLRGTHGGELRRLALFDFITNNADRKAGHCLLGPGGRIWCIDHGLTFHTAPKLRTVIWDFAGQKVSDDLLRGIAILRQRLAGSNGLRRRLLELLDERELKAMSRRVDLMLADRRFPMPTSEWSVPWPPV